MFKQNILDKIKNIYTNNLIKKNEYKDIHSKIHDLLKLNVDNYNNQLILLFIENINFNIEFSEENGYLILLNNSIIFDIRYKLDEYYDLKLSVVNKIKDKFEYLIFDDIFQMENYINYILNEQTFLDYFNKFLNK